MATTTARGERLALRLAVSVPGAESVAVELDAPIDASVGAVVEALGHAFDIEVEELVLERTGRRLPRDAEIGDAGLRHGDRLTLTGSHDVARLRTRRVVSAPLELAVVGGPAAGRRFPLTAGDHVVGRDAECAVRLDDHALSGRHLRLRVSDDGSVSVADIGSRNGTQLEGATLAGEEMESVSVGAVISAGRSQLTVERPQLDGHPPPAAADGTIRFNRPPRVQQRLAPAVRPFPPPPDTAQRARLPLGASLIPLALGLGLYIATRIPTMLFFAALSPLMALSTFLEDRRGGRKGFDERRREYRKQLAALRDELEEERARELAARRTSTGDAAQLLRRAARLEPALWERRAGDSDFLTLRVGAGDLPSFFTVRIDQGGDPTLRKEAEELAAWYATVAAVPVEVPFGELGAVGICGTDERVDSLARSLVAQAAVLHSPRDLVIAAALTPDRAAKWNWLVWLPHTAAESTPLARGLVTSPVAARSLVEDVVRLIEDRRESADTGFGASRRREDWTSVLLILDEAVAPERALVADLLGRAAEAGVTVLWLGRERRDLPGECAGIVELDAGPARLSYTHAPSGETLEDVSADGLALDLAEELALSLAPVRDTSARAGGGIPERVRLLDLLGLDDVAPDWIESRWDEEDLGGVAGLIGAGLQGPFAVDLRSDGPHALVAGMTGAGKSELLQTLIASLAVGHPPTRLAFLLVDYKGGAAFKDCTGLPHTVGLVTDLDAHLTQRALVSLNAELQRRERLLRDAGAKDLADMERRNPGSAPASLVIVIDEFATLAKEVPDFIDGVVDVAQRGRSLGVHLVLATQRPGGVVSENIRANTNLRIALRVNDAAESSDVIGVPEAARIARDRAGRAYARTGHGELTEFQTAYVGGTGNRSHDDRSIHVRRLGFGRGAGEREAAGTNADSDLSHLVAAASAAAAERGLERPPSPWLPPLAPIVAIETLPAPDQPGREAVLGILDDPARQRQEPFLFDLEAEGSLLVYGSSGSGKTTLLRTLALSLAADTSPDELQFYGLDFATRGLKLLEPLPHCGSVITDDDEERTARLFAVLRRTLERRKALFAERGVFNLSELQRAARGEAPPRIVVLLDGYPGFAAAFERVNLGELVEALPRLVGEGRPLGVHFAITADRRGAVPNALAGIIPAKVVLRMADEDEFAALGVPLRTVRGAHLPPGRGFLPGGLELQVALPGEDASGTGQAAAIGKSASRLRERYGDRSAAPIEPLPAHIERATLSTPEQPLQAVIGLGDAELTPATVDLRDRHFLVVGPYRSGRSTTLGTIVESLGQGSTAAEVHLLAPRRSPLADLQHWDSVANGLQACEDAALGFAAQVEGRKAGGAPLVVVIDDGEELAESVAAPALETIVRRGRDVDVRVVCACERQAVQRAFGGWLRELRKEEHGLLLAPDPDVDGDLLAVRLPRRTNPVFPPGRGYLVERGRVELVQVAGD
jgi:DNA segregation ATPase FtsK/SpoIIIE, S-DNA-T family